MESLKNEAPKENEGREWYVLNPHRRKKRVSENAEPLTEKREHNLRRRVFSCWNAKTKPPLAGRNLVRILIEISPVK